mmetsp:Transcript_67367/g.123012  ORF Transcript_67367/g.123012 Transcript_67367/m.123012 type:complete len:206 (+) Transcript_67367:294-911(+)
MRGEYCCTVSALSCPSCFFSISPLSSSSSSSSLLRRTPQTPTVLHRRLFPLSTRWRSGTPSSCGAGSRISERARRAAAQECLFFGNSLTSGWTGKLSKLAFFDREALICELKKFWKELYANTNLISSTSSSTKARSRGTRPSLIASAKSVQTSASISLSSRIGMTSASVKNLIPSSVILLAMTSSKDLKLSTRAFILCLSACCRD